MQGNGKISQALSRWYVSISENTSRSHHAENLLSSVRAPALHLVQGGCNSQRSLSPQDQAQVGPHQQYTRPHSCCQDQLQGMLSNLWTLPCVHALRSVDNDTAGLAVRNKMLGAEFEKVDAFECFCILFQLCRCFIFYRAVCKLRIYELH